ncbi:MULTISPECIES: ATP-dependent zinc protease [unclassified Marinobacter]|uniref:ATP-dependent zinc protease family protein n=1 Tax=unclassified Marinobacter TaxID=83889 RepID=UPI0026E13CFD|nr:MULTISPECIES: ATP-dependent zinc protease [unclassified Marinobacter]MDO6442341.1 ATP-dependent zinc protease [Marinobacter sp. 2_MG-2023]MDO6824398.1 ATP-dependent zinc protease [Marinobacter sp. 1_MG-2023]
MKSLIPLSLATALVFPAVAWSETAPKSEPSVPETLGFVEWVVMNDTGLRLKARLDTGAKTSSLHAVNVEEFKQDDQKWVKFQIPLADHKDHPSEGDIDHEEIILELERPVERTVLIKRKGAPSQRRYVVMMDFCIAGASHKTQFSLTDRGNFSYPVLLGRRFMRDDNILIDSADSFIANKECEYMSLEELAEENQAKIVSTDAT